MAVCPQAAIKEKQRKIGIAEFGRANGVLYGAGKLDIGAIQSPALIKHVRQRPTDSDTVVIDVPPGTSCPVIEAVKGADFVLLVTEPTPFGLNDLELAVEMVRDHLILCIYWRRRLFKPAKSKLLPPASSLISHNC